MVIIINFSKLLILIHGMVYNLKMMIDSFKYIYLHWEIEGQEKPLLKSLFQNPSFKTSRLNKNS